ncbi:zinc finger MYM-type protein 1 [Trichonephila clavipes]|nr:zinc finger MYM-type protein 1 [Trichonephila clavipes]
MFKTLTLITAEQSNKNITNERNLSKENGETQQANINDENMQDLDNQQPSEKGTVQPEDVSNAPTEKCEGRKIRSGYLPFRAQVLYRPRRNYRLCGIGVAIRGTEKDFGSPHMGNFMGTLELLAEFDPFICEHVEQRELRPNSLISYLSKTIYEQIIEIMGKQIIETITTHINNNDSKYYSIVMDSTPDLSHNDQLAIVLRYCFRGKVYER